MSITDNAKEIIRLASRYDKEKDGDKKSTIIEDMTRLNDLIIKEISSGKPPSLYEGVMDKSDIPSPAKDVDYNKKRIKNSLSEKMLIQELKIDRDDIKRIYKQSKKARNGEDYDFTVYVPSTYGKIANSFFANYVATSIKNKNSFFNNLSDSVKLSGMNILSKTYISIIMFTTLWASMLIAVLAVITASFLQLQTAMIILISAFAFFIGGALTFAIMYAYPAAGAARKSRDIKNDLPFVVIHMSAVAGSGAKPISIFKLLLKSGEYKGMESEIKKIVNFVNLFGYDLSTALKLVSLRTPSKEFRDLLNGMASTIESGGSLKSYLSSMAEDFTTTYRLERKKYVESLSTYSDIYTGILIAAPLLFMVTLAIINIMGGTIGGLSVSTIAWAGTIFVLPLVNIMFYLFLNITQPEE
ncbi:MAG: type II secretion system F family protein [Nanoarchaeota archaeon]|nr:type II secretion system F family protein [Nanoarchaeota archaeon]